MPTWLESQIMLKSISFALLPLMIFFGNGTDLLLTGLNQNSRQTGTGTYEKMIVASGSVAMRLDASRFGGMRTGAKASIQSDVQFEVERDSFFTTMIFNGELRGPLPGSMKIIPLDPSALPAGLSAAYDNIVIEHAPYGEAYELVLRDGKTGFLFFNIEGHTYEYDSFSRSLGINQGRILLSKDYAAQLGRPDDAGTIVGEVSISATLRPIEVMQVMNGEIYADVLPAIGDADAGGVPGPDVIVGDVMGLAQFGSASGSQVGLAVGTNSCNAGVVDLNWFALPNNDHPVIPQNLYRMSGGAANDERFEQIGQSSVKHAFTALTQNLCSFGCNGVGGSRLGSGCSDPYSASLNAGPSLGSRAWINPFTGFYPRGDSATPPNNHSGHVHTGPSHRVLTEIDDLRTDLNPGATYYAEAQYVTPHEYAWCQSNPGQCNMYNNVSYRQYSVSGTASPFSFSPVGATVRTEPAINAWPGAVRQEIKPDSNNDGIGFIAYKVTNPSPGLWRYEYAIFNQNLDRAIQSFSVPVGGASISNVGFHAPPQHPAWTADGTVNSAGFSSAPWAQSQNGGTMTWATETFAQNANANAIRWGTMYNFRFESNQAPQTVNATIGFFKTGAPMNISVQAPGGAVISTGTVSGRVMSLDGFGVSNARVIMTDGNGNARISVTNPFGYYAFDGVVLGATYTMGVQSKRFTFASRQVPVNGNLSGVDFTAEP